MKGWAANREEKTFTYDNPVLLAHIANGGNYGVVTGPDRFVVAADTKEVEKAIEERLPRTFTQKSPRHKVKHSFFYGTLTRPIECKPTAQGDPCADVKFGNAYVLGPGSKFEDYGEYIISDDVPIATITEDQLSAALDEFIKVRKKPKISKDMAILFTKNPELNFPITQIIPNIDALMQTGNSLMGPHPTHGSTTGSNFHVETEKNVWKCFRTGHGGGGPLELLAVLNGIIECEETGKGCLRGDKFKQTVAKAQELGLVSEKFVLNVEGESKFWSLKTNGTVQINIDVILNELNGLFTFKTPTDLEDIYYYDNGVYRDAEHMLKGLVETWLGEHGSTYIINEILGHLRRKSYCDRTEFNRFQGLIPVQNGLLDLKTLTLQPFDKNQIFTYKLNTAYDKEAPYPIWEKFVSQILNKEDIPLLQEWMGYCLLPTMPKHKIMWFYGTGRNGKGRVILTLEAILGLENCASLELSEFDGEHRFALPQLYGKMINVSSEPTTKKELQTALLKKITGEDTLDAEVKNKQRRLRFRNTAKPIVLGNKFPKVTDITPAFWERVLNIKFPNAFIGKDQIDNIERMWLDNPQEMSGILNWMLTGLHALLCQNDFTTSKTTKETTIEFKRISDTIGAWLQEKTLINSTTYTIRTEAFEHYKTYCDDIEATPETKTKFTQRLKDTPRIREGWKQIEKKNERAWLNLELIPNDTTINSTPSTQSTLCSNSTKEKEKAVKIEVVNAVVNVESVEVPKPSSDTKETCVLCLKPLWSTDTTYYQGKLAHCVCVAKLKVNEVGQS
jgi:P4 family phage/plasmid primase-like protien